MNSLTKQLHNVNDQLRKLGVDTQTGDILLADGRNIRIGEFRFDKRPTTIDFDSYDKTFKEGKFTKTDSVPAYRVTEDKDHELIKIDGYGTKIGNEVYFIQKNEGSYDINYKGVRAGRYRTLKEAKAALPEIAKTIHDKKHKDMIERLIKRVDYINKNGGSVTEEELKRLRLL